MKVQILTTPDCSSCSIAEKMFNDLGIAFEVIDVTVHPEYLQKYPIFTAPGIVINGKLEFTGIPKKEKILDLIKNQYKS